MSRYIVDLTMKKAANRAQIVSRIRKAYPDFDTSQSIVIASSDQDKSSDEAQTIVPSPGSTGQEVNEFVVNQIKQLAAEPEGSHGDTLTVFSYNYVIEWAVNQDSALSGIKYVDLRKVSATSTPAPISTDWDESFIDSDTVVRYLITVLSLEGGSIKKAGLRDELKKLDSRFERDENNPKAFQNQDYFISRVVNLGISPGYVEQQGGGPNPLILLTPAGKAKFDQLPPTISANQYPAKPERESDLYLDLFKSEKFGPYQEVRVAVYDQIEKLIRGGEGASSKLTIAELFQTAIDNVRKEVEQAIAEGTKCLLKNPEKGYPWSRVRSLLAVLFARCPVLKRGDELVPTSWINMDGLVDGIAENWQDAADAEFIIFLLEKKMKISVHEEEDLAGAIFDSRRPAATEKVRRCIKYLVNSGRCTVDPHDLTLALAS